MRTLIGFRGFTPPFFWSGRNLGKKTENPSEMRVSTPFSFIPALSLSGQLLYSFGQKWVAACSRQGTREGKGKGGGTGGRREVMGEW